MPATPALRRSSRLAPRAISPVADGIPTPQAPSSTHKAPAAREIRSNWKRKMKEKEVVEISDGEDDPPAVEKEVIEISDDDDDPPTVKDAFLGYLKRNEKNALKELRVVKQERAQLVQEVAKVKLDRDQLLPIVAAVKQFLECPICLQYMEKPVTIPCGHIFCEACFTRLSEMQKVQAVEFEDDDDVDRALQCYSCPVCRTYTNRDISPTTIYGLHDVLALLPSE